ncbi:hypothetical protein ACFVXH_23085 [Kitasatospora sp. NPDC058184]|uniref:hypothetical protein n=1 Tax=Kitasatospora sp. NPDC058184 TaxID=3346370 RepID=UPI0036DE472C
MDFPSRKALDGLTEAEHGALAAMHGTVSGLHAEWRSALAVEMRLRYAADAAEGRRDDGDDGVAPRLDYEVARELNGAAFEFSQAVEVLLWRTASAYAVLGITMLDRLVAGNPPLSEGVVGQLCEEPLLGAFEAAVTIPVEQLLVARDGAEQAHARKGRRRMAALVEQAYGCLEDEALPAAAGRVAAARSRLSVAAPEGFDAPWLGYLEPLVGLARQGPYEISAFLRRRA